MAGSLASGMRIARRLYDEMVSHALEDAPDECCGMIASRDGEAVNLYRATNAAHSPLRYEIDGAEQYRIQMAIDDADLDLGAIYHSHTRSEPYPSQTDINLAFYPGRRVRDRRAWPRTSPRCGRSRSATGRWRRPSWSWSDDPAAKLLASRSSARTARRLSGGGALLSGVPDAAGPEPRTWTSRAR